MRLGVRGLAEFYALPDADLFAEHTRLMFERGYAVEEQ